MELTSFPESNVEAPQSSNFTSLYGRMYSAASQVLNSLLSDEQTAQSDAPNQTSSQPPQTLQQPLANNTSVTNSKAPSITTQISRRPSQVSTSTTLSAVSTDAGGNSGLSSSAASSSVNPTHSHLLNSNTGVSQRATSRATVGVSGATAVPTLPTMLASSPAPSGVSGPGDSPLGDTSTVSFPDTIGPSDTDSLFSVASTSASRDYLTAQYARGRNRARPGGRLSRDFWMKDENASTCFGCNRPFTTFRRRHHCRVCGQIFCSACTRLASGQRFGQPAGRRVRCCATCEDALEGPSSSDEEVDGSFVAGSPRPPSALGIPANAAGSASGIGANEDVPTEPYAPYRSSSPSASGSEDEANWSQLSARSFLGGPTGRAHNHSVSHQSRRSSVIEDGRRSRGNSLSGFGSSPMTPLVPVGSPSSGGHAGSGPRASFGSGTTSQGSPISGIGFSTTATTATMSSTAATATTAPTSGGIYYPTATARFPANAATASTAELNTASLKYAGMFLDRIIGDSELPGAEWHDRLLSPLLQVTASVNLSTNDRVAPREWVKIKCVPGGTKEVHIEVVCGHVFSQTLAHRSMPRRIASPRLLLISFPIEYSRGIDRYMSLGPVLAQQSEYLRKLVARILSLQPTMVLTCSHVCGDALDMLDQAGISVAMRIRPRALVRLAQYTHADLLGSIDRLSSGPRLGTCTLFEMRAFRYQDTVKTYMFFTGRPSDPGRAALVRGNVTPQTAHTIKIVLEIMVDVVYSLKMETALMRDQFVQTPAEPAIPMTPNGVLSSSPFVDYGEPFLKTKVRALEDDVVRLSRLLEQPEEAPLQDLGGLELAKLPENTREPSARFVLETRHDYVHRLWVDTKHQWDLVETNNPYLFNPSSHQNLVVLYSVLCTENGGTPCVGAEQVLIEFYLDTDQTLGQFVEAAVAQEGQPCPADEDSRGYGCGRPWRAHHRQYVHGYGKITVHVEPYACRLPGLQNSILMWSHCKICHRDMPVTPMSPSTWKYSFGKYLELSFWGMPLSMRAGTCGHNIYRDHVRYFGWHDRAVRVEYEGVDLYEISAPPLLMTWDASQLVRMKIDAFRVLGQRIRRFWASVLERLNKVRVEGLEEDMLLESRNRLDRLRDQVETDRQACARRLDMAFTDLAPSDYMGLNNVVVFMQQLTNKWHAEFADFDGQFFPTERDIRRVTAAHLRGLFDSSSDEGIPIDDDKSMHSQTRDDEVTAETPSSEPVSTDSLPNEPSQSTSEPSSVTVKSRSGNSISLSMAPLQESIPRPRRHDKGGRVSFLARHFEELSQEFERERQREKQRIRDRQRSLALRPAHPIAEVFEDVEEAIQGEEGKLDPPADTPEPRQSNTGQFGELDRVNDRHHHPQHHPHTHEYRNSGDSLFSNSHTQDDGNSHIHSHKGPGKDPESGPVQGNVETRDQKVSTTAEDLNNATEELDQAVDQLDQAADQLDQVAEEERKEPKERVSLIKSLANFWAERSSTRWDGIEYVLGPTEHLFANSLVIIRESEPSSIMAFCLSLPDYRARITASYVDKPSDELNEKRRHTSNPIIHTTGETSTDINEKDAAGATETPGPAGVSSASGSSPPGTDGLESSSYDDVVPDDSQLKQAMLKQTGTHMRYHFGQGSTTFSCKIFFSEQFDALRRKCGCSDDYIQSLSRCNQWDATGGKSGSSFLKTLDDRLVIKELSQAEFDAFATFAPSYFEYMAQALFHDLPTVLAKFYGFYQITVRNSSGQQKTATKMYVLVMENLFYGRHFTRFFDLKGSMRNRKVAETGRANEVLLDENMVEFIYEKPLFVREHSKKMLRASLYNDTLFLTKMNVMDYSLVIGIDDESRTIVAGIIDFVRTYTWDKKIESWVKGKASTGVKEPTVVSPKQYKVRFRESMEQYFLMVPDCWNQLSVATP